MLDQINNFFTIEVIYLWLNIGVIPFWMCLIIFPSSSISRYFIKSIFPFLILSGVYSYLLYTIFKLDYEKMKLNCKSFKEELVMYVFHPKRINRF